MPRRTNSAKSARSLMCHAKYTHDGYKTFLTKAVRKVYNEPFAMLFPEACLTANAGSRCPSCEAANPPGRDACGECGARLSPGPAERQLPEEMPGPGLADRSVT